MRNPHADLAEAVAPLVFAVGVLVVVGWYSARRRKHEAEEPKRQRVGEDG